MWIDFFYPQTGNWLYERYGMSTKGVLTHKIQFNLEKFKQSYFDKMDFLSHFE